MAKKALCIGINDYPGTQSDLSGCVNDAHDWAEVLDGRGFSVRKLIDAEAVKETLQSAMGELVSGAEPGDTLVFTYSGHGTWVPDASGDEADGRDEGWCPHDIRNTGALLDDEIHALFGRCRERVRILLLSDSCHSGSVTRGDESDLDEGLPRARFLPPEAWMPRERLPRGYRKPETLLGGLARVGGDLLLSGCMDTEYSWDTQFRGRPNGAFTYYAIKTLKTLKPEATYEEWYRKIRDYLPSTRLPQNPQILGSAQARRFRIFE
jgi:hypothetical protein